MKKMHFNAHLPLTFLRNCLALVYLILTIHPFRFISLNEKHIMKLLQHLHFTGMERLPKVVNKYAD